jgi:N-acetylmuramoyl-L-alanine amidase
MIKKFFPWLNIVFILLFVILCFPVFAQSSGVLSLEETLGLLGQAGEAELRWDPFFASGTLSVGQHQAAFVSGRAGETGMVLLDHRDVLTLPLPFLEKGDIMFPEIFVSQVKHTFDRYIEEDRSRFRIAAIIIDPGHGGRDSGAVGEHNIQGRTLRLLEKDIALNVARQVHAALAVSFPDKRVFLTREGDTNPRLEERVALANSVPMAPNEAAIYVSVHANGSFNRQARGFEVWYLSPGFRRELIDRSQFADSQEVIPILNSMLEEQLTTESIILANAILRRMGEAVGDLSPSRGLKAEEWFVVRNARMPSVLVELGFVTNERDAILMNDAAYLKKLSEALYKGISDFISFFERSGGFISLQ